MDEELVKNSFLDGLAVEEKKIKLKKGAKRRRVDEEKIKRLEDEERLVKKIKDLCFVIAEVGMFIKKKYPVFYSERLNIFNDFCGYLNALTPDEIMELVNAIDVVRSKIFWKGRYKNAICDYLALLKEMSVPLNKYHILYSDEKFLKNFESFVKNYEEALVNGS
mgnify:CR=1 FL=1